MAEKTAYEVGVEWGSCSDALEARKQYNSQPDWYKGCNRGDYLLWQLQRVSDPVAIKEKISLILGKIVTRSIKRALELYKEPEYVAWAEKWLSGEDRSESAAAARAAASAAEWAARAAASAAEWAASAASAAAEWAASAASAAAEWAAASAAEWAARAAASAAARAARAAARAAEWAAELELQAQDIHEIIPEWPG